MSWTIPINEEGAIQLPEDLCTQVFTKEDSRFWWLHSEGMHFWFTLEYDRQRKSRLSTAEAAKERMEALMRSATLIKADQATLTCPKHLLKDLNVKKSLTIEKGNTEGVFSIKF
jgi:hypothetical protein